MTSIIHVAVAVIVNDNNEVCLSLRHQDSHQGGLWEFPGGKVEHGETVKQALLREIKEELALDIIQSRRLISIKHDYVDKKVCLHVHKVLSYQGQAVGVEGQPLKWVAVSALSDYDFPVANKPIIKALQLPERYLITGKFIDKDDFLNKLKSALDNGIKLVQLRLKDNSFKQADSKAQGQVQALVEQAAILCKQFDAKLMLNLSEGILNVVDLTNIDFSGFHADSRTLNALAAEASTETGKVRLFSASCHNMEELKYAAQLKADFVVLSPVQQTASHPEMDALGWQQFSDMIAQLAMPVYALGGVSEKDIETAWSYGGQGVAAISAFWH